MGNLSVEARTPRTSVLNTASSNVPTGFSTAAGSQIFTDITSAQNLYVNNGASTAIQLNITAGSTSAPSTAELTVPASTAVTFNDVKLSSSLYVKSTGSAISSGTIIFNAW